MMRLLGAIVPEGASRYIGIMRQREIVLVISAWLVLGAASSCGGDDAPKSLIWSNTGASSGAAGALPDASAGTAGATAGASGDSGTTEGGSSGNQGGNGNGGSAGTAGGSGAAGSGGAEAGASGGPGGSAGVAGEAGAGGIGGDSGLPPSCPDGVCNGVEACDTCPADCGSCGCEHPPCVTGSALDSSCSPCVASICAADSLCCDVHWDYECAIKAVNQCYLACACEHGVCVPGSALASGCNECATSICDARPSCCNLKWDDDCVAAVATTCASPCPGG